MSSDSIGGPQQEYMAGSIYPSLSREIAHKHHPLAPDIEAASNTPYWHREPLLPNG